jgi:UDPglucose 6-dehydrogenase
MKITIIGTGYVGLVTGACFAEVGHQVDCIDINSKKIQLLKIGVLPFYEPGLDTIVERNHLDSRLYFKDNYSHIDQSCSLFFIAVPTPSAPDGKCDLTHVYQALESILANSINSLIIVIKSTTPPGTIETLEKMSNKYAAQGRSVVFVSNPEFLKEGSAVADCMKPDRIIIGSNCKSALKELRSLYAPFTHNHDRIIEMDPTSAEMTKYASNAMLATRISFMNELSKTCENIGANINAVRVGMGSDSRIGYHFLYAGIGWGGSCFPKDIRALIELAKEQDSPCNILEAVYEVNQKQKTVLCQKIISYFNHHMEGKIVAIWGLSFKPDTDDIREAPSLEIIEGLLNAGAKIKAYDPICMPQVKEKFPQIEFCQDPYMTAHGADCVALLTEWKQFRSVDFKKLKSNMRGKAFFDGRNQFNHQILEPFDLDYIGIGQGRVKSCVEYSV